MDVENKTRLPRCAPSNFGLLKIDAAAAGDVPDSGEWSSCAVLANLTFCTRPSTLGGGSGYKTNMKHSDLPYILLFGAVVSCNLVT